MPILDIERADHSVVVCDTEQHMISYAHYHVVFTPVEWKIVKKLYESSPKFVSRDDLLALIWNNDSRQKKYKKVKRSKKKYPTRIIDVHIASIRKKLSCIKGAKIDSLYGKGYRFIMIQHF